MKKINTAALRCFEQLEAEIEKFLGNVETEEMVKMNFLEQSAKYLGVYIANEPKDLQHSKTIN